MVQSPVMITLSILNRWTVDRGRIRRKDAAMIYPGQAKRNQFLCPINHALELLIHIQIQIINQISLSSRRILIILVLIFKFYSNILGPWSSLNSPLR